MNAVTTIQPSNEMQMFDLQQRQARMFATSPLVPDHLRKGTPEQALANCYIALKLAEIMGEAPLIVMQNIHVVQGKAGFDAKYMIARANKSGVFKGRINWTEDKSDPQNLKVAAFATLAETDERIEFEVDMKMATDEGWTRNPKYKSMPALMLRYRSATFLIRLYAPEVMLGYHTVEEYQDMAGTDAVDVPASPRMTREALADHAGRDEKFDDDGVVDAEVSDETNSAEPSPSESLPPDDENAAVTDNAGTDKQKVEEAAPASPELWRVLVGKAIAATTLAQVGSVQEEFDQREAEVPFADQGAVQGAINEATERLTQGE